MYIKGHGGMVYHQKPVFRLFSYVLTRYDMVY